MLYLALAVASSTSIAIIFRISEGRGMNRYTVTTFNYLIASLVSLLFIVSGKFSLPDPVLAIRSTISELPDVLGGYVFSIPASMGWAIFVGIPAGVLYFLGFIYYQKAVRESGVSLAGSFARLGILVPMTLSVLFWGETPSAVQWIGISLATVSIVLANTDLRRLSRWAAEFQPVLIVLLLVVGLGVFTNKVFQKFAVLDLRSVFLFCVFFTALLISTWKTLRQKKRVETTHILTGLAVGIPNYFASFFLIRALAEMGAAIVFPLYSCLTIVMISLLAWLIFGERLDVQKRVAISLTAIALVLVNIN